MAIKIVKDTRGDDNNPVVEIALNNGDVKALNTILDTWKFKDIDHLLGYAIAVLLKAKNNRIYIDSDDGKIAISPSQSSLKNENSA